MGDRRALALGAALLVATLWVYAPVTGFGVVSYDDPGYVSANPHVRSGLDAASIRWAFTSFHQANWHPLTWLSLMLDRSLFGSSLGAAHAVSLLLHLANTGLLFFGLRALTGATGRSAWVAGAFALHPLHVESVAWLSARKDVLSALFGLGSIGAWAVYARARERGARGRGAYVLCALLLALGLMAKPMLVTWPFVFLLLDVWPLRRGALSSGRRGVPWPLLVEKLPLLALSLASAVLTLVAQSRGGAVVELAEVSLPARIANAALACAAYLEATLWPRGLAVLYPHAWESVPFGAAAAALAALALVTALLLGPLRRRRPLAVGWCFFLGTLVPVIGLVQVGLQARADRYTYLPLIGVFTLVAWGLGDLAARAPWARRALAVAGVVSLTALAIAARAQVGVWRDSETLFRHALAHTGPNPVAHVHLAAALVDAGRRDEAVEHYRAALELSPTNADAWVGLGNLRLQAGEVEPAREAFQRALGLHETPEAWIGLGNAAMARRDAAAARSAFRRAVELAPHSAEAHHNLGAALAAGGDVAAALPWFEEAVRLDPGHAGAAASLARARAALGAGPPPGR